MKGKFCVVRCRDAGVHAGVVKEVNGNSVLLEESRRLWYWRVPMGASSFLSGVATAGLDAGSSKVGGPITVLLTEACEVIECTPAAEASIRACPVHVRTA
jgi:hypothetical protein